jgi:hypothetical protein
MIIFSKLTSSSTKEVFHMGLLKNVSKCSLKLILAHLCLIGLTGLHAENQQVEGIVVAQDVNTPIVNFTFPDTDLQQITGMVTATINAVSINGISSLEFLIDNMSQGTVMAPPYAFPLDTTTLDNGLHLFTAIATDMDGNQTVQNLHIYVLNNFTPILINCGGNSLTYEMDQYSADEHYTYNSSVFSNSSIVGNPVYQTERFGSNFSYNIPLPPCKFIVTLEFAEIYFHSPGQRVFSVGINGPNAITNLDLYKAVGFGNPYVVQVPVVSNGNLNIRFKGIVNNAKVNAIQIQAASE